MSGAQLSTEELAFLLASLGADHVVDLQDPELFPQTASKQQKTYQTGLEQLVENGWVGTDTEDPAEAGLDPALYHLAAIIAAPEFVVSTSVYTSDGGPVRMVHYMAAGLIVGLDAPEEERYRLGLVEDVDQLGEHLSQFLGTEDAPLGKSVEVESEAGAQLKSQAEQGKLEACRDGFTEAGLGAKAAEALAQALSGPPLADIVGARVVSTEVEAAVRCSVFGHGQQGWLAYRAHPEAATITFAPAGAENLAAMLATWMGELLGEPKPA